MNSMSLGTIPPHFKYALAANLPLLLLPAIMLAGSSAGLFTDQYGNNWFGILFTLGLIYWIPAAMISLILLAFSVGGTGFSRIISVVSCIYGLSFVGLFVVSTLFG